MIHPDEAQSSIRGNVDFPEGDSLLPELMAAGLRPIGSFFQQAENMIHYRIMLIQRSAVRDLDASWRLIREPLDIVVFEVHGKVGLEEVSEGELRLANDLHFEIRHFHRPSGDEEFGIVYSESGKWTEEECERWLRLIWRSEAFSLPSSMPRVWDDQRVYIRSWMCPMIVAERSRMNDYVLIERFFFSLEELQCSPLWIIVAALDNWFDGVDISDIVSRDRASGLKK